MLPVVAALNAYREAREITFRQLESEMASARARVPARTLYYMSRPPRGYRPRALTLKKIQRFIDSLPPSAPGAVVAPGADVVPPPTPVATPTR